MSDTHAVKSSHEPTVFVRRAPRLLTRREADLIRALATFATRSEGLDLDGIRVIGDCSCLCGSLQLGRIDDALVQTGQSWLVRAEVHGNRGAEVILHYVGQAMVELEVWRVGGGPFQPIAAQLHRFDRWDGP